MRTTSLIPVLLFSLVMITPLRSQAAETPFRYAASQYDDEKGVGLNLPEGVACANNRLVVADTGNGRLVLYTVQDGALKGGTSIKIPQLLYPVRVKITSKGDILALDERQRKIVRLSGEGVFQRYVEPTGVPNASLIVPAAIDLDQADTLFVLDIAGNRVLVLDADGKYQRQIPLPATSGFFDGMAVDGKGTVFVIDSVNAMVYSNAKDPAVFSLITATSLKDEMKFGSAAVVDDSGMLYIADEHGGGVVTLAPDGTFRGRQLTFGYQEGYLRYPAQMCVDAAHNLFIADRENSRIEEFSPLK